jgi:transposase InsO family protein
MGMPNVLLTDNGPQFASEAMQTFLKFWGISWTPSSPRYPQNNGHAESMVKNLKYLLAKTGGGIGSEDFLVGLLEYRNTP